jgi:hypothetical protein
MSERESRAHAVTLTVGSLSPAVPLAGTEMTMVVEISCEEGCDLTGSELAIAATDGTEMRRVELGAARVGADGTRTVRLTTPTAVGPQSWAVWFPPQEVAGLPHDEASADVGFDVEPHPTSVVVWGIPSALEVGASFGARVGVKCRLGCDQTGRPFEILDGEGNRLAAGAVGAEPHEGTKALHFTEIELAAPLASGRDRWEVRFGPSEEPAPHASASRSFGVLVVDPPEHMVTVVAIDKEKQAPVRGAHVLLHPFRARTDEHGVARVRVKKGAYQLFVSGFDYFTFQSPLEVTEDVETKVELLVEPVPTGDEHY